MNKRYCTSCGTPNSYIDGVAPKFCGKCGKALQFVPTEKPVSQAAKINVKSEENLNSDDLSKAIEKAVAKRLNALLSKGGDIAEDSDSEDLDRPEHIGEIPTPSTDDAIVQTPKFMTLGELKNSSQPVTRGESPKKFNDYSK